jgi:hypothetical protein
VTYIEQANIAVIIVLNAQGTWAVLLVIMNFFIFFLSLANHMPKYTLEMIYHLLQNFTYSQFNLFCTAGPTLTCAGERALLNILKINESANQSHKKSETQKSSMRNARMSRKLYHPLE